MLFYHRRTQCCGRYCAGATYIGIGAVIKHGVEIGKNTVIGGNSFVNKKCLDNSLYFGTPVKKIKSRKKNSKYL